MFTQQLDFEDSDRDLAFHLCSDLLSVASELGIENKVMLNSEMGLEELQSTQSLLESIIEAEYEAKKDDLRRMKRCPQGYKWNPEGPGWRCEGGSHYCSAEEIKQFMD